MFRRDCTKCSCGERMFMWGWKVFVCKVFDDFCTWPSSLFSGLFIGLLLDIVILFCILCILLLSYCWSSSLGCHLSYENLESWQLETVDIRWLVVVWNVFFWVNWELFKHKQTKNRWIWSLQGITSQGKKKKLANAQQLKQSALQLLPQNTMGEKTFLGILLDATIERFWAEARIPLQELRSTNPSPRADTSTDVPRNF